MACPVAGRLSFRPYLRLVHPFATSCGEAAFAKFAL